MYICCIWSTDYIYNVHCSQYLVHGSDPLSLRRASSPVHVACLVDDQDLFLKTKQRQIKNICRGYRFLMISDRNKIKSRSRSRMWSFWEFFYLQILNSWGMSMLHVQIAILLLLNRCKNFRVQPGPVCSKIRLTKPRSVVWSMYLAQFRGRINNKQKKKKGPDTVY